VCGKWGLLGCVNAYWGLFNIIANYFRVKIIGVGWCDDGGVGESGGWRWVCELNSCGHFFCFLS